MGEKKKVSFPSGFFTKERPVITNKQALQDVVPINWSKDVEKEKKKTIIDSSTERKVL